MSDFAVLFPAPSNNRNADDMGLPSPARRFTPKDCPHCAYDRRFPETADGGWVYFGNNGPIVPCVVCIRDQSGGAR